MAGRGRAPDERLGGCQKGHKEIELGSRKNIYRSLWETYCGKAAVRRELLDPLFAQFADRSTNTALRFIAEDDYMVVECRGRTTTRNNTYCYVCRFSNRQMVELTEYLDTALVARALEPPGAA
jgi:ketosteroid isomerase-like protein